MMDRVFRKKPPQKPIDAMQILVADDHYANRLLTQSLLQRCGHEITLTNDGQEALDCCKIKNFDVILLDIQMPNMDGIQALQAIKQLDNDNSAAPTFALTAFSDRAELNEILKAGFLAVLKKPFRVKELMGHLDRPYKNLNEINIVEDDTLGPSATLYHNALDMPLLENHTLDILIQAVGKERMAKILKAFWQDAGTMMASLKDTRFHAHENSEATLVNLRRIAHGLKGACANIGLLKASRLAAHLQNAPIENIPYLIVNIEDALQMSENALAQYCAAKRKRRTLRATGS